MTKSWTLHVELLAICKFLIRVFTGTFSVETFKETEKSSPWISDLIQDVYKIYSLLKHFSALLVIPRADMVAG